MSMGMAPGGSWVTERGTIVPSTTPAHNPELEVRLDGQSLGFKVKDMLPERRWSVDEFGHVLELREFTARYQQWFASHSKKEDPILVAVPDRREFVSGTYDRDKRATFIGFDPGDPGRVKPVEKYDHRGEVYVAPAPVEDASVAETRGALKVLAALYKAGKLTAEEYADRVIAVSSEPDPEPASAPAPVEEPAAPVTLEDVVEAASGDVLTPREREVIEHVGRHGVITNEMAEKAAGVLAMHPGTVRSCASKARAKLQAAGR